MFFSWARFFNRVLDSPLAILRMKLRISQVCVASFFAARKIKSLWMVWNDASSYVLETGRKRVGRSGKAHEVIVHRPRTRGEARQLDPQRLLFHAHLCFEMRHRLRCPQGVFRPVQCLQLLRVPVYVRDGDGFN